MTVETTASRSSEQWMAEDEIDLRQYLDVLIRWWREIVGITFLIVLLTGLAILAMRLILPPRYITSANVAIVRTTSEVNFTERFRTTEEEIGADTGSLSARRSALLGLVATGAIAQQVIAEIGDSLEEEERVAATLIQKIEAEAVLQAGSRSDSDLIRITVTADTPRKAALIANSWAKNYVREVNLIYSDVPDEVLASIQTELTEAETNYLTAQTALETFIANNRIAELSALVTVLQQQVDQEVSLQQAFLSKWQRAQEQLNTVQSLQAQIEAGDAGAVRTNLTALQVLKISVYGMTPSQLQVELRDFPELTAEEMLTDVAGLITAIELQIATLETEIAANNEELRPAEENRPFQTILLELRDTQSRLEAERARQRQLNQQRDLSWETYQTLSNKVAELSLTRAAATSEVRMGTVAVAPVEPTRRVSLLIGLLASGFIGIILALVVIVLASYLDYSPIFYNYFRKSG